MNRVPRFTLEADFNANKKIEYTIYQYFATKDKKIYLPLEKTTSFYEAHTLLEKLEDNHGSMTAELIIQ